MLFGGGSDGLVGSARSIEGINIYEALGVFADRYEKFGGHAQAAGLTIRPEVLEDLWEDVCAHIRSRYDESAFVKKKTYDMALHVRDITQRLVDDIARLEPFGPGNEEPGIAIFGADIVSPRFVGKDAKPHLKFVMRQNGADIEAVSFFFKDTHSFWSQRCDFLCQAAINDFNGRPQMIARYVEMTFDEPLVERFLAAGRDEMALSFIGEVTRLGAGVPGPFLDEASFSGMVGQEMQKSRFGLCVTAATLPAMERLIRMKVVRDALENGRIALFDPKSFTPENCVAWTEADGHTRVCRVGISDEPSFFDMALFDDYAAQAPLYFAPREELLEIYKSLIPLTSKKKKTHAEAMRRLALSPEKAAFAFRVLLELKLIETDESGRILALKCSEKKDLRESACFRSFEDLIKGAVFWKN